MEGIKEKSEEIEIKATCNILLNTLIGNSNDQNLLAPVETRHYRNNNPSYHHNCISSTLITSLIHSGLNLFIIKSNFTLSRSQQCSAAVSFMKNMSNYIEASLCG